MYASGEGGPRFDERVASMQLPLSLPVLFISADGVRSGVQLAAIDVDPRFQVRAADSAFARTALAAGVLDVIANFGQAGHRVDLSVDGQQLVAGGAPKDPDQRQSYLEGLARIARALESSRLASYVTPAPPPGFGFYGHPDWQLIGRDDTLIAKYGLTTAGSGIPLRR